METIKNESKYFEAKRKVKKIRAFYYSLISSVLIIGLLSILNYYVDQWRNPWFLWAAFGWGIGLFAQASKIFEWEQFFGKKWEEKKLKKLMNQDSKTKVSDFFDTKAAYKYQEKKGKTYINAKREVEILKAFYLHLMAFIFVNSLMVLYFSGLFSAREIDFSFRGSYMMLFFWGIGLISHGIYVLFVLKFKNSTLKRWEEKKIKEILEKDNF